MSEMKATQKSVTLSVKAYEIAARVDAERKELGMCSSIAGVISEAIVKQFGEKA